MLKKPRIIKTIFALIVVGLVALLALFMIMHSQQETADLNAARANAPGKFIQLSQGKVHYLLQGFAYSSRKIHDYNARRHCCAS